MSWHDVGKGLFACYPQAIEGRVRVVMGLPAIIALMKEPEGLRSVIVTNVAGGSAVSTIIRRAQAIVSTVGGPLSHIVVVARDYEIPCIVGVADLDPATLINGARVRLNQDGRVQVEGRSDPAISLDEYRLLRLIVFAGAVETDGDILGFGDGDVNLTIQGLREGGFIEAAGILAPTKKGLDTLEEWYAADRSLATAAERQSFHARFEPLDRDLKRVARMWQEAVANDNWDARLQAVEDLSALHGKANSLICECLPVFPRFGEFNMRLEKAHAKVMEGELDFVVGVRCDSYHTAWFQFHEDLLRLLQRERAPEEL